ncbi:MAG: hypothetical protein WC412_05570 [Candidatus Omnitrophota bacterium]|jgi:hypothetical protein
MKRLLLMLLALNIVGCATTPPRIQVVSALTDKSTEILSAPPGARIEINNEFVGETPLFVEINRYCNDWTGAEYCNVVINAIPKEKGQYAQTKFFDYSVKIPKKIFFDMRLELVSPKKQYDINVK